MHDNGEIMDYILTIETTSGKKTATVSTTLLTSDYPFGFVSYRQRGSCDLDPADLEHFWDLVDEVLSENLLTSDSFIRAINAKFGNIIIGEDDRNN